MSNRFPPMPALVGNVEEDTRALANQNQRDDPSEANNLEARMSSPTMSILTQTKIRTHCFTWTIDGRSLEIARLAAKGEKKGVIDACVEKGGHEFKLELCASGWRNSQDGYCAFYLTSKDEEEPLVARYRVHTADITRTSSIRHDFHLGVGFPNFCEQTIFDGVGPQETIVLCVTVEEFKRESHLGSARQPKTAPQKLEILSKVLEGMHTHKLHTDVTVICRGQIMRAHKAVLASCSPVLDAMFRQPDFSNEVIINEFSPQTVRSCVRFIYTAKLGDCHADDLASTDKFEKDADLFSDFDDEENQQLLSNQQSEMATQSSSKCKDEEDADGDEDMTDVADDNSPIMNMFRFARKYEMISLIIACCRKMQFDICVENTCKLLTRLSPYSHVPEIQDIQESVCEYAKENYQAIRNTDGFRALCRQPTVVFQFLDKLA